MPETWLAPPAGAGSLLPELEFCLQPCCCFSGNTKISLLTVPGLGAPGSFACCLITYPGLGRIDLITFHPQRKDGLEKETDRMPILCQDRALLQASIFGVSG